jgi:xylulokinase
MGTAEAVFLSLDRLRLDDALDRANSIFGAHVARDRFYAMDGLWTSGAAIEWAISLLLGQASTPDDRGPRPYARLEALARQAPPGSLGVFFLPRLAGGEHGTFVGLTTDTGPAALARAVYEGLAYEWRRCLEQTETALGLRARSIKVIGGGTRSALWLQIKSDVLGRPLHVLEVEESVALGAALLAGLACEAYRDEADAVARLHCDDRVITPNPESAALYERCYQAAYLRIAPSLSDVHQAIAGLSLAG